MQTVYRRIYEDPLQQGRLLLDDGRPVLHNAEVTGLGRNRSNDD